MHCTKKKKGEIKAEKQSKNAQVFGISMGTENFKHYAQTYSWVTIRNSIESAKLTNPRFSSLIAKI